MKRGFTLIELLVVIAILAILAAILMPVFARAKSAGKTSVALSQMQQMGLAWQLYDSDSDGALMPDLCRASDGSTRYWWGRWDGRILHPHDGLLSPYAKSPELGHDPTFANTLRTALGLLGYGYNASAMAPNAAGSRFESSIEIPGETIVFATTARLNTWSGSAPVVEGNAYLDPPSHDYPGAHARHGGAALVVWADGHAARHAITYRTGKFGLEYQAADFRRAELGDLCSPNCPLGSACQDYYFLLGKS